MLLFTGCGTGCTECVCCCLQAVVLGVLSVYVVVYRLWYWMY